MAAISCILLIQYLCVTCHVALFQLFLRTLMKVTRLIAAMLRGIKYSRLLVHSLLLRVKKVKILRMRVAPRYTDLTTVRGVL